MATKTINIGPFGPFEFDDTVTPQGVKTNAPIEGTEIITTGLSTNRRLVESDTQKKIVEVNDLTVYLKDGTNVQAVDQGDGTVKLEIIGTVALVISEDFETNVVGKGYIVKSPDGSRWRITVDNAGAIVTTAL